MVVTRDQKSSPRHQDGDERWMRYALTLARRGVGRTSPNPMVGAVVVADGQLIGEGYHPAVGEPHAEVFALDQAGVQARGATLYVTLEPCAHHGRTPPCVERIVRAGVRRVVSAMEDPDPRVRGRGHRFLQDHGVEVLTGVCEQEARSLNAPYVKHRTEGLPYVTLKIACSLDGKVATRRGESQWITGESARWEGHRLRHEHDAILVGIGTVLADDPLLTVRHPQIERPAQPLRVVLDSSARLPIGSRLVQTAREIETVVAVGPQADSDRCAALVNRGVQVWRLPTEGGRPSVRALLERLAGRPCLSVLVEGGPTVHWSLVEAGLVDRVVAFVAPVIIGGETRFSAVGGRGFGRLSEALRIQSWEVQTLSSGDLYIDGFVRTY